MNWGYGCGSRVEDRLKQVKQDVLQLPCPPELKSWKETSSSESMNLQLLRFGDLDFSKKLDDVVPLIALELNYLSILRMFDYSTVTCELLLRKRGYGYAT